MSERRYGYFRCPGCNTHWESSHTYEAFFNVEIELLQTNCKKCDTACAPYRVEFLICSGCGSKNCRCTQEEKLARHINLKRPHRSYLCHKCRSGHPCQHATF